MGEQRVARVVIGDDSGHVRSVLRWLLEEDGRFRVTGEAATGIEVLALAGDADVVLLDVAMPELDGLSALAEIRHRYPGLPVVMCSSHDVPFLRAEALRRGAAAYVAKSDSAALPTVMAAAAWR